MADHAFTDAEKAIMEALWQKYIPMPDINEQTGSKEEEKE